LEPLRKTGRFNIAGPEVKDCLVRHAVEAECGVIGVTGPERGQVGTTATIPPPWRSPPSASPA